MISVLEVNVDDLYSGGVFSLIRNVIINKNNDIKIDIASVERFKEEQNIREFNNYGSSVYYIGCKGNILKKHFFCYFKLKKLIRTQSYDYIHIHADVASKLLVFALAAKHEENHNIVLHSHASGVDGKYRIIKYIVHKVCSPFLRTLGANYIACSDYAAQWMFPNIPKDQIGIIKNGIDLGKFRFSESMRQEIRATLGLKQEILLGHVGRFAYQKNHEYLISIMREVNARGLNAKMIFVGEGPDKNKIKKLVKSEQLEGSIIFYGTSYRVDKLFQAMDIFLLPSHFEGLPIVGVEAQASGLPVLFSDQITKEAKLTAPVKFLPIQKRFVSKWVKEIENFSKFIRRDTHQELKEKGYDIQDTIDCFLDLYRTREK